MTSSITRSIRPDLAGCRLVQLCAEVMHGVYAHSPPSLMLITLALGMATPEVSPPWPSQDEELFRNLDDYPWDADAEFQGGLRAILGPNPDPERAEQLTLRARCFYYSRHATLQYSISRPTNDLAGNTTFQLTSRRTGLGIRSTHLNLLPTVLLHQYPPSPLNRRSSQSYPSYHQLDPTPIPPPFTRTLPQPFPMTPHPPPPRRQRHQRPLILPHSAK